MFKVDCPGCAAPYQVDERRVPSTGLKMRCPKCGASFNVTAPGNEPEAPRNTQPAGPGGLSERAQQAGKKSALGGRTVLGVSGPKVAAPPRPAQRVGAGTMIGVAPGQGGPPRPVPRPDTGPTAAKPPLLKRPNKQPTAPTNSARTTVTDEDLPSVLGGSGMFDLSLDDLPDVPSPKKSTPDPQALELDDTDPLSAALPEVAKTKSSDPFERGGSQDDELDMFSLPPDADEPALPEVSLPAGMDADLPDIVDDSELPSLSEGDELPSLSEEDQLPMLADGDQLPSLLDDDQLPSLMDGDQLPSLSDGDQLPTVAAGDHLPMLSAAEQLPSLSVGDALPSVSDKELTLPSVAKTGTLLPSRSGGLGDDDLSLDAGGFGEVDLPTIEAGRVSDFPPAMRPGGSAPPSAGAARFEPVKQRSASAPGSTATPSGFDLPDLDKALEPVSSHQSGLHMAASLSGEHHNDFGPDGFDDDFDFGGPGSVVDPLSSASGPGSAVASGPGGAPGVRREDNPASYGEVALGDDDDDGSGGLETDDGMEFGAIPQEEPGDDHGGGGISTATDGLPRGAAAASAAVERGGARATPASKPKRKRLSFKRGPVIALLAALGLVIVGGALALIPRVGPFGAYFIADFIARDKHAALYSKAQKDFMAHRGQDTYSSSKVAVDLVSRSMAQATRYRPLSAFFAFAQCSLVQRFGPEPARRAKATVILDEFADDAVDKSVPGYQLALACRQALDNDVAGARKALTSQQGSGGPMVTLTLGELELGAGDYAGAEKAFSAAFTKSKTPWAQFGLARSFRGQEKWAEAKAAASEVLKQHAEHAGAALLLAELAWQDRDEVTATKYLDSVLAQQKRINANEKLLAHTLFGQIHAGRGRLSKAEAALEEALAIDPKNRRALIALGDVFFESGRFAAALARYESAAGTKNDAVRAQLGVAKCQMQLDRLPAARTLLSQLRKDYPLDSEVAYWDGMAAQQDGDPEAAGKSFEFAIEHGKGKPDAVLSYVALAQLKTQLGLADQAEAILVTAKKELPDSALLEKAMGHVALSQGVYDKALASFKKARELDPEDVGALFDIGVSQRRLKQYDQAWKTFESVAAIDKDLPGLPLERGLLLEESGRSEEALREYETALAKAPEDMDLMLRVGCGRAAAGDGAGASKVLAPVLLSRPKSAEVHHCVGRALWLQGQAVNALQRLQRAVELDYNRAQYHLYVGWVANEVGQVATAERALDEALQLDKGLADAYWQRAVLLLRQGAALDAIKDLKTALALRPGRYQAHAELAQAYYRIGKEGLALSEWQKALAEDDKNPLWLFRYGKLLYAKHRNREAAASLTKAIKAVQAQPQPPTWLWEAHHLAAASLGGGAQALNHWEKFLELGPEDSPYRQDAKKALIAAGRSVDQH